MCDQRYTHVGKLSKLRRIKCDRCGEEFDHKLVRKNRVVLAHGCPEWVELGPSIWAPCALSVHSTDVACIGEMAKQRILVDYTAAYPRRREVPHGIDATSGNGYPQAP